MKELIAATFAIFIAFSALIYRSGNVGFGLRKTQTVTPAQSRDLSSSLAMVAIELRR